MNLVRRPELIDRLASAYALGTLRGSARRRFESLARQRPAVRQAAMVWQTRLSGLTELEPGLEPVAVVWTRIRNQIDIETQQAALVRQAAPSSAPVERTAWWGAGLLARNRGCGQFGLGDAGLGHCWRAAPSWGRRCAASG